MRVRDLLAFLGSIGEKGGRSLGGLWKDVKKRYYQQLANDVRVRAWKRALETARTEDVLWNPLLDRMPLHVRSNQNKKKEKFRDELEVRIDKMLVWVEEAPPEQRAEIFAFEHPELRRRLMRDKLHCFQPRESAQLLTLVAQHQYQTIGFKILENERLTSEHVLAITRQLMNQTPSPETGYQRCLASHPEAHSGVWRIIMDAHEEQISRDNQTGIGGDFYHCKRWMRHEPSRKRYLELADTETFWTAVAYLDLAIEEVGSLALRQHPESVAAFLLAPQSQEPWRQHHKIDEIRPRLVNWLESQPRSELAGLLKVEDTETRQKLLLQISKLKSDQPYQRQTEGPGTNQPEPRTTPFQDRRLP